MPLRTREVPAGSCGSKIHLLRTRLLCLSQACARAQVVFAVSTLGGLMMWGMGVWWLVHGVTSVATRFLVGGLKFNMGFWGFIFPLGVFTTARASQTPGCRRLLTHAGGSGEVGPQQQHAMSHVVPLHWHPPLPGFKIG